MAPREGHTLTKDSPRVSPTPEGGGPRFWSKITSLPIVQSTKEFYAHSKGKSSVLNVGLNVIETGVSIATTPVSTVVNSIANHMPDKVHKLDNVACTYLDKMEDAYPVIATPPNEVVEGVKTGTRSRIKTLARGVLRTLPGRLALKVLDTTLKAAEAVLDVVDAPSKPQAESSPQKEPARPPRSKTRKRAIRLSGPWTLYNLALVFPVKIMVSILRDVKRGIVNIADLRARYSSPMKKQDIQRRRKLTPHKRTKSRGYIRRTFHFLASKVGLVKPTEFTFDGQDIRFYLKQEKPDDEDHQKVTKRKYEELYTSEESDSDIDIYLEDLSEYASEEDPDYMPGDADAHDSFEFEEGDTESDIEVEGEAIKVDDKLEEALKAKGIEPISQPSGKRKGKKGKQKGNLEKTPTGDSPGAKPGFTSPEAVKNPEPKSQDAKNKDSKSPDAKNTESISQDAKNPESKSENTNTGGDKKPGAKT